MGLVAVTQIQHGEENGDRLIVEPGEDVSDLPKDVVDDLKAQGLVVEESESEAALRSEADELRAKVEELQAQLAAAQNPSAAADADAAAKAATKAPAAPKK